MREIVNRAFRWGLFGLIVGPAITYSMMLGVLYFNSECRANARACNLDMALNLSLSVIGGFVFFFGVSFVRGLMTRLRDTG